MTLEQHAEAILRLAGYDPEIVNRDTAAYKAVLTACAALMDAGAVAMRRASFEAAMANAHEECEVAETIAQDIAAIDPASLRKDV